MAELDNLQIKISADTMKAISAINKLNNSLKKMKDYTNSSGAGFEALARQTNMFCNAIKDNLSTLERYAAAMQKISNSTNRRVPKAPTKPRKVKQDKVETETGITKLPDQQNTIKDGRQGALQHINNLFKKLKVNTDKATKSASMFVKVLKRMVLYMALRTVIQSFLQSINKGAELMYRYAQTTEQASVKSKEFVATMDRMASNSLKVDAALGSLKTTFSGLSDAWSWFVTTEAAGWSRIVAWLKGEETYWSVNTDAVKKYEGALKSLTSQYDELNTLSNANEVDYSTLMEERYVDSKEKVEDSTKATNDNTKATKENTTATKNNATATTSANATSSAYSKALEVQKKAQKLVTDAMKGTGVSIDDLNGKKLNLLPQEFTDVKSEVNNLNIELASTVKLLDEISTKQLNTTTHKSSSGVTHGGGGLSESSTSSKVVYNLPKGGGPLDAVMTNLTGYASGGFVQSGEIFVARESGPEMIGTIGGQGAVANNADIVQAIAQGVADAIARGNMTVSVSSFEGGARSLIRSLDNSATLRRLGGI